MSSRTLELQHVTKMYNANKGIRDVSFILHQHEIHGLIGVNGAGKTSIIKCVMNQIRLDSGTILWQSQPVSGKSEEYKKYIGYVPDDEVLLDNLTPNEIVEFVGYAYGLSKEKINKNAKALFELLQLQEVDHNVSGFSRGMRKKVQLVSALIANPKLLILDEPIAGFDPHMIFLMKQLFLELRKQGTAFLISTHDLNFANQICDRVTMIHQGQVLMSGNVQELLAAHNCTNLEELFVSHTLQSAKKERLIDVVANL